MAKPGRKTSPLSRQRLGYHRARCQAKYRGEEWELDFYEYWELWIDHWEERGRGINDMCMIRLDKSLPWRWDNVKMVSRGDYLTQHGRYYDRHIKQIAIDKKRETHRRKREKMHDA